MANKQNKNNQKEIIKHNGVLNNLLSNIQKGISSLYKNTYFSPNSNKEDLNTIKTNIDSNIDNLLNNNVSNIGTPNISKLYSRMNDDLSDNKNKSVVEDIFNDKSISDSFLNTLEQNRMIVEYDEEIDTILKYMPQLENALEAKKDNVLSADQYSKDYINAINTSNISSISEFESRIKSLKEDYKLLEFFDTSYDNIAKYGEDYIYIVPYKKALAKILNNDAIIKSNESAFLSIAEQAIDNMLKKDKDIALINVNESTITDSLGNVEKLDKDTYGELNNNIELIMGENALLIPSLKQKLASIRVLKSVNEAKFNKQIVPNDLEFDSADTSSDGLIDIKSSKKDEELSVPGCIIKRLKRENVIPIYIDEICLGYYYIECKSDEVLKGRIGINDPMLGLSTNKLKASDDMTSYNKSLRHISGKISDMIDARFINANYDLKKEIYAILKHSYNNEGTTGTQVTATYIAPEDMHHGYFKLDPKTHRGVSDLHKSLVPAKMWVSLSTTSAIGVMTRGYDRRVYYVKQSVDTNISQTLLNTINQIKKANFGTREFGSIKNVLNITGRYNDMVMPLNSSGDAPIQFEIMPGQNIDIKTDLMDMFEKSAIESTEIPFEYVSSIGQIDFAIRLTMSNGKFLRNCFRRQAKYEPFMSRILTVLYNTEYEENDKIDVRLPAPAFLNIANTSQMMDNVEQYCEKITNMIVLSTDSDIFRTSVKNKLMKHYLSTYLDMDVIEEISNTSKIESSIENDKNNQQ